MNSIVVKFTQIYVNVTKKMTISIYVNVTVGNVKYLLLLSVFLFGKMLKWVKL